jgi:hypothetical protein
MFSVEDARKKYGYINCGFTNYGNLIVFREESEIRNGNPHESV